MSCPRSNQGGFLGSYVPPDHEGVSCPTYRNPGVGQLAAARAQCHNTAALDPHFGLATRTMFPSATSPGDGFDQVFISAPTDLLAADGLLMDGTTLTNNKRQSRDLRGDIPVNPTYSCDERGQRTLGPFGGMMNGDTGYLEFRKPLRTYIV
jgi:hypothetical protein